MMERATAVVLLFVFLCHCMGATIERDASSLEEKAREYLVYRNAQEKQLAQDSNLASWNYESNLTNSNREAMMKEQEKAAEKSRELWREFVAEKWPEKWRSLQDPDLRRQFNFVSKQGASALTPEKLTEYEGIVTDMTTTYGTAKVHHCVELDGEEVCELSLDPELSQLLEREKDYDTLTKLWVAWRNATGKVVRQQYLRYVELTNEVAKLNDFEDGGEMWRETYESEDFAADIAALWEDLRPLYLQLHAYARRKLREQYGEDKISKKGPIPAHLTGNMWAQSWTGIESLLTPYPNKPSIDVTDAMKKQGYTPLKMFQLSNDFFKGLNLTEMSPSFWENTIMERPKNTELVCHASAWDMASHRDFRIKMCTDVNMGDLITIHHEMGHIEYYEQYRHQPLLYQTGANPGFHEAVGDSLALSVMTPKHLKKVGLLHKVDNDAHADINFLMKIALSKVVFLPFGYLIDMYRWDIFSGKITSDNLNCEWWNKRFEFQGIKPPVKRSEEDFDAGAKYHVVASVPYIRYFVSCVVQFQFHKAMCEKSKQYARGNHKQALHNCDNDQSADAGNALASMLKMGASKPWPEALEKFTGNKTINVDVLREYFKPLEDWLIADNAKHGEYIGWEKDGDYCA